MKRIVFDFVRRGLVACGFGPLVLAALYLILKQHIGLELLTVNEVCLGILSLAALAFISGGINVIYQLERLPLVFAILIHGLVLYLGYLGTYLLNSWLALDRTPILVFSCIFVFSFLAIWGVIYWVTKRNTEKLNQLLQEKQ